MFLDPGVSLTGSTTERYEYIQSSEPDDMQTRFGNLISALIAENTARVAAQLLPFNIYDVDISGGGDGFTFIVRVLLSTAVSTSNPALGWLASQLHEVGSAFWLAASRDAIEAAAKVGILDFETSDISNVCVGTAGASQGTRFMAFIAGVQQNS